MVPPGGTFAEASEASASAKPWIAWLSGSSIGSTHARLSAVNLYSCGEIVIAELCRKRRRSARRGCRHPPSLVHMRGHCTRHAARAGARCHADHGTRRKCHGICERLALQLDRPAWCIAKQPQRRLGPGTIIYALWSHPDKGMHCTCSVSPDSSNCGGGGTGGGGGGPGDGGDGLGGGLRAAGVGREGDGAVSAGLAGPDGVGTGTAEGGKTLGSAGAWLNSTATAVAAASEAAAAAAAAEARSETAEDAAL